MKTPMFATATLAVVLALLLSACAPGREFIRNGSQMIEQGKLEEGMAQLEKGIRLEPENREYRMLLIRQRDAQVGKLLTQADAERADAKLDAAELLYRRAEKLSPGQARARAGIDAIQAARNARAQAERARLQPPSTAEETVTTLKTNAARPVTLDFRDANIKAVFEALSKSTGLNFVFDRDVRTDIRITISIQNMSIDDVVSVLATTNQLERKRLNENTVLLYPNNPQKQKEYLDLSVRTFYLANAEAKSMFTMLKTVLKTKDLYADEKLNSLTMRDTPDAIRLAEKLIAAQDFAEPEVLLDVEVLEVKRSRLLEIGLDPPGKFSALNLVKNPDTVVSTATGNTTVQNNTLTTTQLTLDKLRGLGAASIGIDSPTINFRAENGDTNILANPRIRVKNRDKARILIGDRVPVITTTSTANVGVAESVSYLDVGLKLDVEPNVFLDNDVGVKVTLEVSNLVREVKSRTGTLTYQIGTRLAATNLRLKDGETQALAGLFSDEDRKGTVGAPGFVDLPILGRLFSSERNDSSKTEIGAWHRLRQAGRAAQPRCKLPRRLPSLSRWRFRWLLQRLRLCLQHPHPRPRLQRRHRFHPDEPHASPPALEAPARLHVDRVDDHVRHPRAARRWCDDFCRPRRSTQPGAGTSRQLAADSRSDRCLQAGRRHEPRSQGRRRVGLSTLTRRVDARRSRHRRGARRQALLPAALAA
jgi:general secretion pathway protein D